METVTVARHAMATRFEIVLHGANPLALRSVAEGALDEIERIENVLSLFKPSSEVAHLNASAAREPVRVTPELFRLIEQSQRLNIETDGAFDLTVGPLTRTWKLAGERRVVPDEATLHEARAQTGMQLLELDAASSTVRFLREGVSLDFGAIGKGYAIECVIALLREAEIESALVHGGTSTVGTIGVQPDGQPWRIAIEYPDSPTANLTDPSDTLIATTALHDESLSVSAVWGKSFVADGKEYGHVVDPRTGLPTNTAQLAAVILPSATETDALSTALLVSGGQGIEVLRRLRRGIRTLIWADGQTFSNL